MSPRRARLPAAAALVLLPAARALQQEAARAEQQPEGGLADRAAKLMEEERRAKIAAWKAPSRPGCYVYMPAGCPRHPEMATNPWYRDIWHDATVNRTTCEVVRPKMVKSYCNSEEISLVFVEDKGQWPAPGDEYWDMEQQKEVERLANEAKGIGVRPQEPVGEAKTFPLGSAPASASLLPPNRKYKDAGEGANAAPHPHTTASAPAGGAPPWQPLGRQDAGEADAAPHPHATASAPADEAPPRQPPGRKEEMESPALPSQPGCYVLTPYGCPLRTAFEITARKFWVRDVYGERHLGTGDDRAACVARKDDHYAKWCGVAEVRMGFVPGSTGASPSTEQGVR